MVRFLRPLLRGTTYTRLLHLWVPMLAVSVWLFIDMSTPYVPALVLAPLGLVPSVRRGEGVQARLLLTPGEADPGISETPSATWPDRLRTVLWLEIRMVLGATAAFATVWLPGLTYELTRAGWTGRPMDVPFLREVTPHWFFALLAPLPLIGFYGAVVALGELVTLFARRLLGPSAAERLAALEERTEGLLERARIARELHDSIGHALTAAVLQAGAARAADDPAFTDRALEAIEETGRAALEDLDRVLGVLRESERPPSGRPTLADAGRLLESARASGAVVEAEVTGALEAVPVPVSREGYRILQEALTNVLRHAGTVPVGVRIAVDRTVLVLEIRNPIGATAPGPRSAPPAEGGSGRGLRGIRERASLLGGMATTGPVGDAWQVRAELPLG